MIIALEATYYSIHTTGRVMIIIQKLRTTTQLEHKDIYLEHSSYYGY